jgi:hypothetical protein
MSDPRRPTRRPSRGQMPALLLLLTASAFGLLVGASFNAPNPLANLSAQHQVPGHSVSPTGSSGGTTRPGPSRGGDATASSKTSSGSPSAKASASAPGKPTPRPKKSAATATTAPPPPTPLAGPSNAVFMHYYLWWTPRHWHEKLGTRYPYTAKPLPAPGRFDASGCNPTVKYPGATVVDIPTEGLYDQGQGATFDLHIAQAAAVGISGFVVSWQGIGVANQGPGSSGYNARLDLLVSRVNRYNAAHGASFRLVLGMEAFGNYGRPASQVVADLEYFRSRYSANPAFSTRFSRLPMVMLLASRRYPLSTVQAISTAERGRLFLLGDETYRSWSRDAPYLDGSAYYWSSQDPWGNPQSGSQVAELARQVHAAGKPWFAPFTGGFNTQLIGGSTCVARRGVATLDAIWNLNRPSRPQAWFGISWNEFVENTYLEPSTLFGRRYLDEIGRLIRS